MTDQREPRRNAPRWWFKLPWGCDFPSQPGVYLHVLCFLINTLVVSLFPISMWKFILTQLAGQGLVTGPWSLVPGGLVARIQHFPLPRSWLLSLVRNQSLLQGSTSQGHLRSAQCGLFYFQKENVFSNLFFLSLSDQSSLKTGPITVPMTVAHCFLTHVQ